MWFDSTIFPLNKVFEEGDTVVLDTLQFDLNATSVKQLNSHQNIYELTEFLKKRPEWVVQIYVLTNTNYDTTSNHFLRTQAKDIYKSLIYYNIDPSRFQVKDSVVLTFDKQFDKNKAYRKIVVILKEQSNFSPLWNDFNEAYQLNNDGKLEACFDKMVSKKAETPIIPTDLKTYQITNLIDQFYQQFYTIESSVNYKILPHKYEIEIGEVNKYVMPDEYIEELEITIAGFTSVGSMPDRFYEVTYQHLIPTQKVIYFKESYRSAMTNFLQYNFSYDLDEMTNIPSNIEPIHSTKKKLKDIEKYIKPIYDYKVKGSCNMHTFWKFHWDFQDANTPILISINEEDKTAFIEFKEEERVTKYAKYQYSDKDWVFMEVFETGLNQTIPFWKYFVVGIFCLFFLAIIAITITLKIYEIKNLD